MVGISEWFQGQTVFITGGSGFLGQALIYKLLKIGCPKIFVLIRSRKGKSAEERLEYIIKRYTFDSIREKVNIPSVLTAIPCAINGSGLGISDEHQDLIFNEVTVVLHGAASVKFDDPLKVATNTNIRMTRDILELTKGIKNLKLFTYISTAFANCDHMINGVEEKLYDAKMDWRSLIDAVDTLPDEMLNSLEAKLLGASPNTYIFTKHLTESLVNDYSADIPVLIIRPPIGKTMPCFCDPTVIGSAKEPEPGWMNNLNSPTAIVAASGKGVLRIFCAPPDAPRAYVMVDIVVNGTLAAIWRTATEPRTEVVPVYNTNYTEWTSRLLLRGCIDATKTHPMKDPIWYLHFHCVTNRHLFLFLHLLAHVLPGLLLDGLLLITRRKPMLTQLYRKIYLAAMLLSPFTHVSDFFHWNAFKKNIMDNIPEEEKDVFYVDPVNPENYKEYVNYLKEQAIGIRTFLGEPRKIHPRECTNYKRLYYLDLFMTYTFYIMIIWFIPYITIFGFLSGFFFNFMNLFEDIATE